VHADHPSLPLDPLRVFLTQAVHCTAPALPCQRMHAIDRSPVWRVLEPGAARYRRDAAAWRCCNLSAAALMLSLCHLPCCNFVLLPQNYVDVTLEVYNVSDCSQMSSGSILMSNLQLGLSDNSSWLPQTWYVV
jgi:hypothetical protein